MPLYKDHLQRWVEIPEHPQKIISLCPSITETLIDLGLRGRVVGRTRFCIHPKGEMKDILRVGGTKEVKMERIHQLKPDLIIAEKEENTPEMVQALEKDYPVYVSDVTDIDSGLKMIRDLGEITGQHEAGVEIVREITTKWIDIPSLSRPMKVLYFIWKAPYMVVGSNTYIDEVLKKLGFENIGLTLSGRYPEISIEEIKKLNPDVVLLSSEPYPFKEKHIEEFRDILPNSNIAIVDGEMFSWYGSRMLKAADYFKQWVF